MGTSTPELLLGELAVKKGLATESEVETALDLQKQAEPAQDQPAAKVGEILLEMGSFSEDDLKALLAEQSSLREGVTAVSDPPKTPARLVQESSDPVVVNGEPVTEPRALVEGDRVRIGGATFRFEGGEDLLLIPAKPATPTGTTVELPAVTPKAQPAAAAESPPPEGFKAKLKAAGARTWEKTKRLFRDVTGKRAKEKAAAIERRDALLKEFAAAAFQSGFAGPEAEAAAKAKAAAEEAEKKTGVAARGASKLARDKADRALFKLGRTAAEKGAIAEAAKVEELRALDAAIKDLS